MERDEIGPIVPPLYLVDKFGWSNLGDQQLRALVIALSPNPEADMRVWKSDNGKLNPTYAFRCFMDSGFSEKERDSIGLFTKTLKLSPAELAVSVCVTRFEGRDQACNLLAISPQTLKNHLTAIFDKVEDLTGKRITTLELCELVIRSGALPKKSIVNPEKWEEIATLYDDLSVREKQVVGLVIKGYCNKEVARCLGISRQTVKNHMTNILRRLRLSRTEDGGVRGRRSQLAPLVLGDRLQPSGGYVVNP